MERDSGRRPSMHTISDNLGRMGWGVGAALAAVWGCLSTDPMPGQDWAGQRADMVQRQLAARGIKNERVLTAMRKVPRHEFVPEDLRAQAYFDQPLPIGE